MKWNKTRIAQKLRQLQRSDHGLSYARLAKRHQALLSAATYHFGSYRKAIESAGIDYSQIALRPQWTKQRIIALIKQARRDGEDLHWGAVTKRRDLLGRAAFAAIQQRLFGKWDRALHAAGLDADEISRYRTWDNATIAFELRGRSQDGEPLSSGALQKGDPGLHAAAVRYFGTYDNALRAARLDPAGVRQRRTWDQRAVVDAIRKMSRKGDHCSDTFIRRNDASLYGAAVRLFGSFTSARDAAGVKISKGKKTATKRSKK